MDVVPPAVDSLEFESCSRYDEAVYLQMMEDEAFYLEMMAAEKSDPPTLPSALDALQNMYGPCSVSEVAPTELDTPGRRSVSEVTTPAVEKEELETTGFDEKSAEVAVDTKDAKAEKTVDADPSLAAEKDSMIEHLTELEKQRPEKTQNV